LSQIGYDQFVERVDGSGDAGIEIEVIAELVA
jgi:hypothetical protein